MQENEKMKTELETLKLNQKVVLPRLFDVCGHLVYPILIRVSHKNKLKVYVCDNNSFEGLDEDLELKRFLCSRLD